MKPATIRVPKPAAPLWKRLAWFAAIWAASVAALGIVASLIRFLIV